MSISDYFQLSENKLFFSKQQGSDFAKLIANDFNPIHDVDAKKFCVPGDLLFAVILHQYGLYQKMSFNFSGMVSDTNSLILPQQITEDKVSIKDDNGKEFLNFFATGEKTEKLPLINSFVQEYVEFSGKAFPHLLVPLMEKENVMVNPDRPLIVYESMEIQLDHVEFSGLNLELYQTGIDVQGKRAKACLQFELVSDGRKIGCGKKNMILSGLKPYEKDIMEKLVEQYVLRTQNLSS